jgi:D-erythrulose 4-kinase
MTRLFNDPATFSEDMLDGFLDANARYVVGIEGGVVRATTTPPGKVAVVVGGGSGHYPAFCGVVGQGFADGAVVGNIFTSPSAREAASVARAAHGDAGVLLITGNYAGDVMNFGLATEQLRSEDIDARFLVVTDDIASAPADDITKRRGIAGISPYFVVPVPLPKRVPHSMMSSEWPARPTTPPAHSVSRSTVARCPAPTDRCSRWRRAPWDWV